MYMHSSQFSHYSVRVQLQLQLLSYRLDRFELESIVTVSPLHLIASSITAVSNYHFLNPNIPRI